MRRIHARLPIRGLTLLVFAVLLGGSLTASTFARRVLADQERRMLRQRAGEAAALLTNLLTQSQASAQSLAAVALATHGDPQAFDGAAKRDTVLANGGVTALVREVDGQFRVVAAQGAGLTPGQELSGAAAAAVAEEIGRAHV